MSRSPGVVIESGLGIVVLPLLLGFGRFVSAVERRLQNVEQGIEPGVRLLPELAVLLEPVRRFAHRTGLYLYRPRRADVGARNQTGPLQDLEVLAHRRLANRKGRRQFV